MIQELIKVHVDAMQANGDTFSFLHSERDWQNLRADEKVFPAVFLDMPVKSTPKILGGGAFERSYNVVVLFLYKSNLDDNEDQRYLSLKKAEAAQREFLLLLDNDDDNVKSFNALESFQVMNIFDANLDGIVQPFNIIPRNSDGVCLPT
jgi:hypothetical protein